MKKNKYKEVFECSGCGKKVEVFVRGASIGHSCKTGRKTKFVMFERISINEKKNIDSGHNNKHIKDVYKKAYKNELYTD